MTSCFASNMFSNNQTPVLNIPKLRDNGSNWADYQERTRTALRAKGLIRHIDGTAREPVFFTKVADKLIKSDGNPPTEVEIEDLEKKIDNYNQKEYQAHYVIQSTVSAHLNLQIKGKTTAEMWTAVKKDTTEKGQSYKVDVRQRLQTICCHNESDL
jgi:hypothetical protein